MQSFLTVGQQVLILFLLIAVGFFLGKRRIMNDAGARACSDIALFIATPCVIIRSFERKPSSELLMGLLAAFGASVLIHVAGMLLARPVFRQDTPRDRVLRTVTVLSNAGFMGLPLQQALLGDDGVFYGAAYVVVLNLVLWSYGQRTMDTKNQHLPVRKLLFNPGTVGFALGLIVFFLPFSLPEIVAAPINYLAQLNTPLPMLFIGHYLSGIHFGKALRSPVYYAASVMRLITVPIVSAVLMYLCGIRGTLLTAMTISAAAPAAAATSMFAARFRQDTETAVNLVAITTVFSLITMPVLVSLVELIA